MTSLRFLVLLILGTASAYAKDVVIEWEKIPKASKYEIKITGGEGAKPIQAKLDSPKWKGELKFGIYVYQIRAIDRVNRPGEWSDTQPLAVMTDPPELSSPPEANTLTYYDPKIKTTLNWKAVPHVSKYEVQVKTGSKTYFSEIVKGTLLNLGALPAGKYAWSVRAVLEAGGKLAPSLRGKHWTSEPSSPRTFTVVHRTLDRPKPLSPLKLLPPPFSGQLEFSWSEVEGAQAYEVKILRGPAGPVKNGPATIVTSRSASLKVSGEGTYQWQVRALAHLNEKNVPRARGPESTAEFKLDRNAVFIKGSGYVALSTMIAPYSYEIISPKGDYHGVTSSSAMTLRLSGEYWLWPQWGLGLGLENTFFVFNRRNLNRMSFDLTAKYQANVTRDRFGWFVAPKAGLDGRQYLALVPLGLSGGAGTTTDVSSESVFVLGGTLGLDIRKQLSDRWSVSSKMAYFYPLMLSGAPGATITGDASYRNMSIGVQALFWVKPGLGLNAGTYIEKRSISYLASGQSAPEQIFMDGVYFFGSILYSFGN